MGSLLVVVIVAFLATVWVRNTRAARKRWLAHLNLPGVWEHETDGGQYVLELSGGIAGGRYVERGPGEEERGEWAVHGDYLELRSGNHIDQYDLRAFDDGSLGIDGPRRVRRIYRRRASNVVPLKSVR